MGVRQRDRHRARGRRPRTPAHVSHNNSVAASTLFTASDADGDTIVQYDFWDNGAGGGHWFFQRQCVPQRGQFRQRGAALAGHLPPGAGTETIWERASDGVQWSAWAYPSTRPTLRRSTPAQLTVSAASNTVAASNLFTAARRGRRRHRPVRFLGQRPGRRALVAQRRAGKNRTIWSTLRSCRRSPTRRARAPTRCMSASTTALSSARGPGITAADAAPVSTWYRDSLWPVPPDLCGLHPVHRNRCGRRSHRPVRFLGHRHGRRPLVR